MRNKIEIDGPVARIYLRTGEIAIVDAADLPLVSDVIWSRHVCRDGRTYVRGYVAGTRRFLHNLLVNADKHRHVDHWDRNGLNNQRYNLRDCTSQQNGANRVAGRNNVLGVKGVSPKRGKFSARIYKEGKRINLGTFATVSDASDAYFRAAVKHFGEFARRGADRPSKIALGL